MIDRLKTGKSNLPIYINNFFPHSYFSNQIHGNKPMNPIFRFKGQFPKKKLIFLGKIKNFLIIYWPFLFFFFSYNRWVIQPQNRIPWLILPLLWIGFDKICIGKEEINLSTFLLWL